MFASTAKDNASSVMFVPVLCALNLQVYSRL